MVLIDNPFKNSPLAVPKLTNYKLYTLIMVLDKQNNVLLGRKKRGFGEGNWLGFGGKLEPGETVEEGARRELQEECGLIAEELQKIGNLKIIFNNENLLHDIEVFYCTKYKGEIIESEEMEPKWFSQNEIPFETMWAGDNIWYPLLFQRKFGFQLVKFPEPRRHPSLFKVLLYVFIWPIVYLSAHPHKFLSNYFIPLSNLLTPKFCNFSWNLLLYVHLLEAIVCAIICWRRGYSWTTVGYWTGLTFYFGGVSYEVFV
ncbi:hypothetical protein CONCODRAFT_2061 [Conidiobolus coronatus NRRL 28638]|uniref:Oxidized purine nucleoside triphosphate hydrolase n=1 Tax=Conidiobolus coronatus (strain ATCC 28846 / CBS 209.66 / NRRL 28638) TaxID=796925 RepID=A0A137PID6_CONC2|nr:hypothetical protein CONCODRAFT_2061 [Conidiobolus coronatus NRRL 28638]|eukprot:KXN74749.1 hypothetical protein CONCODRAFT_2061 [Conidiobolus coronatus NRRL 28638]